MPKFGTTSLKRLESCHPKLQEIMNEAIKQMDFSVLEGHRNEEDQNKYFAEGKSKVAFPDGKHNDFPSRAVDIAPYPIDWKDRDRQHLLAGRVLAIAEMKGIKIRWGGFFKNFYDSPHFELVKDD